MCVSLTCTYFPSCVCLVSILSRIIYCNITGISFYMMSKHEWSKPIQLIKTRINKLATIREFRSITKLILTKNGFIPTWFKFFGIIILSDNVFDHDQSTGGCIWYLPNTVLNLSNYSRLIRAHSLAKKNSNSIFSIVNSESSYKRRYW